MDQTIVCYAHDCEEDATRACEICGNDACPMHSIKTDEVTQCDFCRYGN